MPRRGAIHIGTSGWNYPHWRGRFYPERLLAQDMLPFYAERLETVEINKSHYRLLKTEEVTNWAAQVPAQFRFACKAHRFTTHNKKLKNPVASTEKFFPPLNPLGRKLGPILFQLPPKWRANPERLDTFLAAMPKGHRYAVEFRDPSWYCDAVTAILKRHRAAFCIYELAGHVSPETVTAPFVYVRLHGPDGKYQGCYDDAALRDWAGKIRVWSSAGKAVYCYFDNDDSAYAAFNAMRLRALLDQRP
jgi:uncharacterized protein YecE (DUF72 family)